MRENPLGLVTISVANMRRLPAHQSELKSQALLGEQLSVVRERRYWLLMETEQGYQGWMERDALVLEPNLIAQWLALPRFEVTAREAILTDRKGAPVADVVAGNIVAVSGSSKGLAQIVFPDQRKGFLPKAVLKKPALRKGASKDICKTALQFLGVPYLWGGNSPKMVDCSGFVKLVYRLNNINLPRDAWQQGRVGENVKFRGDYKVFRAGDILVFGKKRVDGRPHHVGIYLGEGEFIHASVCVRLNSLDPASEIFEPSRLHQLLGARRLF